MHTHIFGLRSLLVVVLLASLVACGAATPTATPMPADPAAGSATTRSVATKYGPVAVPAAPQRVVTLDEGALDTALALGVVPVGALSSRLSTGVAPYLAARVPDIAIVGNPGETNIEAVVSAAPDLILASSRVDEQTYTTLSAIAPTIVPSNSMADWQAATGEYAAALGRTAELEALLADIDTQTMQLRDQLALKPATTGALIRWMPQGPLVLGRLLPGVRLLETLGMTLPSIATDLGSATPHTDIISLEQLSQIDTDWLLVATFNAEGDQALAAAKQQPVFSQLRASQAGQVVPVSAQLWSSAYGPLAMQAMLADIAKLTASPQ